MQHGQRAHPPTSCSRDRHVPESYLTLPEEQTAPSPGKRPIAAGGGPQLGSPHGV